MRRGEELRWEGTFSHCAHAVSSVQVPQEQMVCLAYAGGDASVFSVSSAPLANEF